MLSLIDLVASKEVERSQGKLKRRVNFNRKWQAASSLPGNITNLAYDRTGRN